MAMVPDEQSCEAIALKKKAKAELRARRRQIREAVNLAVKIKAALKYGLNIADAISADALAAIQSAAGMAAQSVLGTLSGAMASALNSVLSAILTIFMSGPQALLSLVTIPYKQAIENTRRERRALGKANANIESIYQLMSKWRIGFKSSQYYQQMSDALVYINNAIQAAYQVIRELEGDKEFSGDQRNAVFNERAYNQMKLNLSAAINAAKPESSILSSNRINKIVEEKKREELKKLLPSIYETYNHLMNEINSNYQSRMIDAQITSGRNRVSYGSQIELIKSDYIMRKKLAADTRDSAIIIAKGKAELAARISMDTYKKAILGVASEFASDVEYAAKLLESFVRSIGDAFTYNKKSQLYCNTVYNIQGLVRALLNEIIQLIRGAGNKAADATISVIDSAISRMESTAQLYERMTDEYLQGSASSSKMSLKLGAGWVNLTLADSLTNSIVVDSLVELINKDDVLDDLNGDLSALITRLLDIPDWNGNLNNWVAKPLNSGVSPYLDITTSSAQLLLKLPTIIFSQDEDDVNSVRSLLNTVYDNFRKAQSHSGLVLGALSSYNPYYGNQIGNLEHALSAVGMLSTFSTGMSIVSTINEMVGFVSNIFNTGFPTPRRCREYYPSMFNDKTISEGAVYDRNNIKPQILYNENQGFVENKYEEMNGLREHVNGMDVFKTYLSEQDDLYSDAEPTT